MHLPIQEHFSDFGYVLLAPGQQPNGATTTFPEEWEHRYFEHRFHEIDPVFDFARSNHRQSAASILTDDQMATPLFEEARLFGADSNFLCVSNLGGNTMVFGGVNHHLGEEHVSEARKLCQATHRLDLMRRLSNLTDPQIDVMEMAEEGMLDKEIASDLGVTISAVNQRKQAICKQVGTSSFKVTLGLYSLWKWGGIAAKYY
ncbi:MAG: hypothetical protein CSA70_03500 [Rhodobacterales bacterium]|nr:MAG: hypothetical protein CSA70_03500 [Rhodobacterales bacterium]